MTIPFVETVEDSRVKGGIHPASGTRVLPR